MKNSEIKETIISYIENKIIFNKINGTYTIISSKDKHEIFYTDNNNGNRKHISIINSDLIKYYRFLKHK